MKAACIAWVPATQMLEIASLWPSCACTLQGEWECLGLFQTSHGFQGPPFHASYCWQYCEHEEIFRGVLKVRLDIHTCVHAHALAHFSHHCLHRQKFQFKNEKGMESPQQVNHIIGPSPYIQEGRFTTKSRLTTKKWISFLFTELLQVIEVIDLYLYHPVFEEVSW